MQQIIAYKAQTETIWQQVIAYKMNVFNLSIACNEAALFVVKHYFRIPNGTLNNEHSDKLSCRINYS